MLHLNSRNLCVAFLLFAPVGCNIDYPIPDLFPPPEPRLTSVPERLALGATMVTSVVHTDSFASVTAEDPSIVQIERIDASSVRLMGAGVGETRVAFRYAGRTLARDVEVAAAERYELWLVERAIFLNGPVPTVPMGDHAFLADVPQTFAVVYYDAAGRLDGLGPAELSWPEGASACEHDFSDRVQLYCVELSPGLHAVGVTFDGAEGTVLIGAEPETDIVSLRLVRTPEEESADPGDVITVLAPGATSRGTLVYGLRDPIHIGLGPTFAYEFDPTAAPKSVIVVALDFMEELFFRGSPTASEPLYRTCGDGLFSSC